MRPVTCDSLIAAAASFSGKILPAPAVTGQGKRRQTALSSGTPEPHVAYCRSRVLHVRRSCTSACSRSSGCAIHSWHAIAATAWHLHALAVTQCLSHTHATIPYACLQEAKCRPDQSVLQLADRILALTDRGRHCAICHQAQRLGHHCLLLLLRLALKPWEEPEAPVAHIPAAAYHNRRQRRIVQISLI